MVNKSKTVSVDTLLAVLKDGRINPDMPLAIYDSVTGTLRGVIAFEIQTHSDGTQTLTIFDGMQIADCHTLESSSEVFP
jgi:hypothetical protein